MFACILLCTFSFIFCFIFYDTVTSVIYTLSLHDALPIFSFLVHRTRYKLRRNCYVDFRSGQSLSAGNASTSSEENRFLWDFQLLLFPQESTAQSSNQLS